MQILYVDIGNTKIKSGLIKNNSLQANVHDTQSDFFNFIKKLERIETIVLSSVWSNENTNEIIENLNPYTQSIHRVKELANSFIQTGYDWSKLGEDRVAAMCHYFYSKTNETKVIIDSGTAITIDFFTPPNHFHGGYIIGGLQTELKALHQNTQNLPSMDIQAFNNLHTPPCKTIEAIQKGVLLTKAYGIKELIQTFVNKHLQTPYQEILTGGDAQLLLPFFPKAKTIEHLTLKGCHRLYERAVLNA